MNQQIQKNTCILFKHRCNNISKAILASMEILANMERRKKKMNFLDGTGGWGSIYSRIIQFALNVKQPCQNFQQSWIVSRGGFHEFSLVLVLVWLDRVWPALILCWCLSRLSLASPNSVWLNFDFAAMITTSNKGNNNWKKQIKSGCQLRWHWNWQLRDAIPLLVSSIRTCHSNFQFNAI